MPSKTEREKGVIDLVLWHKKLLSTARLYPSDPRGLRCYAVITYMTIHVLLVLADFQLTIGRIGPMIDNLREMALLWMTVTKILMVRYSRSLPTLALENKLEEGDYNSNEEKKIYMSCVSIGLRLTKVILCISVMANMMHNMKGILSFLSAELAGRTPVLVLSYHTHRFFNITDVRTYLLLSAYQFPMVYVFSANSITATLVAAFIYHLSGQLSVLAYRIRNTKVAPGKMDNGVLVAFGDIIRQHNKIICLLKCADGHLSSIRDTITINVSSISRTCKTINGIFKASLLLDLMTFTALQGLVMYSVIVNSGFENVMVLLKFILYMLALGMVTFNYCTAGDCIMQQSQNFHDAWYECEWYDMPLRCKTLIIISMIRARTPLQLSALGFYVYSLESFTGLVKSSLAYVSMLRQML